MDDNFIIILFTRRGRLVKFSCLMRKYVDDLLVLILEVMRSLFPGLSLTAESPFADEFEEFFLSAPSEERASSYSEVLPSSGF